MKKINHKAVFYDSGNRWKKIKKMFFVFGAVFIFFVFLIIYSFYYSPFEHSIDNSKKNEAYNAIEEINNKQRPVINQGTFLTIADVFGTKYVKRFGENRKFVILSFDDGPDPIYTPQILDILDKEGIKGSFLFWEICFIKIPN